MRLLVDFETYMKRKGYKWLPDQGLVSTSGRQLFNIAGAAPLLASGYPGDAESKLAASSQSCLRMSSFDTVGVENNKHIFFYMLGHFSFFQGDETQTKYQSCYEALEFLCHVLGLSETRLRVSVHPDDEVTHKTWGLLGLQEKQLECKTEKHTAEFISGKSGYRTKVGYQLSSGRVLYFWDLVYVQFDSPNFINLIPQILMESGMSLDRLYTVREDKEHDYKTSYWLPYLHNLSERMQIPVDKTAYRIADITQAAITLLSCGLKPGPKKQEYVLRKLLREIFTITYILNISPEHPLACGLQRSSFLTGHEPDSQVITERFNLELEAWNKVIEKGKTKLRELMINRTVLTEDNRRLLNEAYGLNDLIIEYTLAN